MKRIPTLLAMTGIGATLILSGCVMPDRVESMQKDLADIRQQLGQMQRNQDDSLTRLKELETQTDDTGDLVTKADLADVSVGIDQLASDVAIVDERLNDMGRRIDRLSQRVQQAREMSRQSTYGVPVPAGGPADGAGGDTTVVGVAAPGAGPGDALPDPEALYNTAYADFSKGNYALAVSGFEEYHEKFPGSALADNALYWVGECHFSQGNFPEAVRAFDRLLEAYSSSETAAAANLKKGLAYLEQNEVGLAIVQLRYVVGEYPASDEAKIAKDKLTSLGATS
jgi:tol-pal system protein YbgF